MIELEDVEVIYQQQTVLNMLSYDLSTNYRTISANPKYQIINSPLKLKIKKINVYGVSLVYLVNEFDTTILLGHLHL